MRVGAGRHALPAGPPPVYRGGSIQRVDLRTGRFSTLYDSCDGKPLNRPNDFVLDSLGGIWFTCLGFNDGEHCHLGGASGESIRARWTSPARSSTR